MGWLEFILAMVATLAWPVAVLTIFFIIRREMRRNSREG